MWHHFDACTDTSPHLAALGKVGLVAVSGLCSGWLGGDLLQSLGLADRPHSMWAKVWWQLCGACRAAQG